LALDLNTEKVFKDLLISSDKASCRVEQVTIAAGMISGLYAYYETKEKMWLLGGSLFLSVFIFDFFSIRPITNRLQKYN
jgi:hypothetical protein